jgi:hypothetical protein
VLSNTSYTIDTSTNLINWSLVTIGTSSSGATVIYTEAPAQNGARRFYRIRLL